MAPGQAAGQEAPKERSALRAFAGKKYYSARRRLFWLRWRSLFARSRGLALGHLWFAHRTPLLRPLKGLDMQYQQNKVVNLRLAAGRLDGLLIRPGEMFSYWNRIGNPTRGKGYLEGMVLEGGRIGTGTGGGLCQLSNLIYWMSLHTPLTVVERHRHGYDVFPDASRTQPFGSGATCCYPHIDLMLRNNTPWTFQLRIRVGEEDLEGEWRSDAPPDRFYEIVERNHEIRGEYWGGYTRSNKIFRRTYGLDGVLWGEELVAANAAIMMYEPFLEGPVIPEESGGI